MSILQLDIACVRNITFAQLPLQSRNVIMGANGSGKSSLLEAIYSLSCGKSFRPGALKTLIQHQQPALMITALLDHPVQPYIVAIERNNTTLRMKINGQWVQRISELAQQLAVQVIHPDSHELLTDGPALRRQWVDWGVFYHEPAFLEVWRRYQQALQQRNQALKERATTAMINIWNSTLIQTGEALIQYRQNYLQHLKPYIQSYWSALWAEEENTLPIAALSLDIELYNGLLPGKDSQETLAAGLTADQQLGYTRYGAHRFDLVLKINGVGAQYYLSRAQQKLCVIALCLAQAQVFQEQNPHQSHRLLLIDDLPAELDEIRRKKLMNLLIPLNLQIIVTATQASLLPLNVWPDFALFQMQKGHCQLLQT